MTLPGVGPLPERWRQERVPSFRRLLVAVRHADGASAIGRLENGGRPPWSAEAQVLDDLRRFLVAVHTKEGSANPPHPLSLSHAEVEQAARAQEARHRRGEQREARRQQRLAQKGGAR